MEKDVLATVIEIEKEIEERLAKRKKQGRPVARFCKERD